MDDLVLPLAHRKVDVMSRHIRRRYLGLKQRELLEDVVPRALEALHALVIVTDPMTLPYGGRLADLALKDLGLTIPPSLLLRADQMIELWTAAGSS